MEMELEIYSNDTLLENIPDEKARAIGLGSADIGTYFSHQDMFNFMLSYTPGSFFATVYGQDVELKTDVDTDADYLFEMKAPVTYVETFTRSSEHKGWDNYTMTLKGNEATVDLEVTLDPLSENYDNYVEQINKVQGTGDFDLGVELFADILKSKDADICSKTMIMDISPELTQGGSVYLGIWSL